MGRIFVLCGFCFLAVLAFPDLQYLDALATPTTKDIEAGSASENELFVDATPTPTLTIKAKPKPEHQGNVFDRTKLLADLMTNYNKKVNPDDVTAELEINLVDFKVRPEANTLEISAWMSYTWKDNRLQWNPEEYGGVERLRIPVTDLWRPDVSLYNSMEMDTVNMLNCRESYAVLKPNGEIGDVPACKMSSQCDFNLIKDPYGEQTCSLKFGSWSYNGNIIDLQFRKDKRSIDLSLLSKFKEFKVVNTTAEKHTNYYPCCADPYVDLTYNITLKRVSGDELLCKLQSN